SGDVVVDGLARADANTGALAGADAHSGDTGPAVNSTQLVVGGGTGGAGGSAPTALASAGGPAVTGVVSLGAGSPVTVTTSGGTGSTGTTGNATSASSRTVTRTIVGPGPVTQVTGALVASGNSGPSGDSGDVAVTGRALTASSSGAIARGDATSGDTGRSAN